MDVNYHKIIEDVLKEEDFNDVVRLVRIDTEPDYYRQKDIIVVSLLVKNDIVKSGSFRVILQRLSQVIGHYVPEHLQGHFEIQYRVQVDKPAESIKMNTAEKRYIEEDVNTLMEVADKMAQIRVPDVGEIIHRVSDRGEFFTVRWLDGTQTTVKLMEGDTSDEYTAFLYALGKKVFGDKGNARKFIRDKKEVFESRMAEKSSEKQRQKKAAQFNQLMNQFEDDFGDIEDEVYGQMFVAPAMISKQMFKRNKGGNF